MQPSRCSNAPRVEPVSPIVSVPTVTIVVASQCDPFKVLIATSAKHPLPILPGGKIDLQDLVVSKQDTARNCAERELLEEVGLKGVALEYLFSRQVSSDIRSVPVAKLRGTLVDSEVASLPDEQIVQARYGEPDHVFRVSAKQQSFLPTEELSELKWCDLRGGVYPQLSAGHERVLMRYVEYLRSSYDPLLQQAGALPRLPR
jgi:8-oxo-dGTP pyrophosphatase MutT (NUDIX family)